MEEVQCMMEHGVERHLLYVKRLKVKGRI